MAQAVLPDLLFAGGAVAFLVSCLAYGRSWRGAAWPPYRGAWLDAAGPAGRPVLPAGFFAYLQFAGAAAFLGPLAAAGSMAAAGAGRLGGSWRRLAAPHALQASVQLLGAASRAAALPHTLKRSSRRLPRMSHPRRAGRAAALLLGGYMGAFVVQMALETALFHRNPISPAIPYAFGPFRFWQLARSLWLLAAGGAPGAPAWAAPMLLGLLAFWVLDHGVTLSQMPHIMNHHLLSTGAPAAAAAEPAAVALAGRAHGNGAAAPAGLKAE